MVRLIFYQQLERFCDWYLLFLWGISTSHMHTDNIMHQKGNRPGDSWNVWRVSFLIHMLKEATREGALLDLVLVIRWLVDHITFGGHLGLSDHEIMEFPILREVRRGSAELPLCRADFGLLRRLIGSVLWEAILKGKEAEEGWALLKKDILVTQIKH